MKLETSRQILSADGLTDKQISIIKNTSFPMYVKAGAGTGKTEVLTRKILYLLETEQIGLEHFAVITFTNKATTELKGRLTNLLYAKWRQALDSRDEQTDFYRLQAEQVNMINIATIHGFCNTLLKTYGFYIGLSPEFIVSSVNGYINEVIQSKLDIAMNQPIMEGISGKKMRLLVREFLKYCDTHELVIDSQKINDCVFYKEIPFWSEFKPWFLHLIHEIQSEVTAYKKENSILTVDDLIKNTAALFADEKLCRRICEKYSVVFVDEFQDTDPQQFYIVNQMIEHGVRVFLVGDDQQAIYSFRGADVESSYQMAEKISSKGSKEQLSLNKNFRSDPKLIRIFNKIFKADFRYCSDKLFFPSLSLKAPAGKTESEPKPFQMVYKLSVSQIVKHLIDTATLKGHKITYNDITILCRKNIEVAKCAEDLRAAGIPTQVIGGKGFYESKEIIDIYKLLNAALTNLPLLQTELQYTDYYQLLDETQMKDLIFDLRMIAKEQNLEELLYHICENTGIEQFYAKNLRYQSIANIHKLRDIAREYSGEKMQPLEFLAFLDRMISTKQEEDEAEIEAGSMVEGVVTLYTIHRAKGLAFNIVIFPFADTNLLHSNIQSKFLYQNNRLGFQTEFINGTHSAFPNDPDYADMMEKETIRYLEEELRIVYVCLTRAKHKVIVSCNCSKQKFDELIENEDYISPAKWIKQAIKK